MKCARCGTESMPAAKFCADCGAALRQASARFASPQAYTPRHLAEKILNLRGAIEGERKVVTVLFADLEDSLEQIARRDPEEASQLLDPVLGHMVDAVHRYEGIVNQVMGDGIMALFGAPVAHEDHAVRACYAALRMQETVGAFAREVRSASGAQIRIRVGVNSGQVVVRSLAGDLRMDYSAVGLTTHVAARLEKMAAPGTILIAPDTRDLVTGYVRVKSLGATPVRGLTQPVEVFEVVGAEVAKSRVHAQTLAGLSRFVGRAVELARLENALERARRSDGQVLALVAAAGMGKSRLYWEFLRSGHAKGCRTLEATCIAYLRTTAYRPVVELIRMLFGIDEADGPTAIRTKITAALAAEPRLHATALPPLLWLLDVPVDDPEWVDIDPEQKRQRVVDGVKGVLARESRRQPLIILVEDIHWADAETQKLLDALVESLPALAVLLLVSFRPDYRNRWGHRSYSYELRVDPLTPESAAELLRDLVGTDPALDPLKRLLVARAEGNPFFLEEMVKMLRETGVLAGDRGAGRLAHVVHAVDVPPTVQAILAARVDRLPDADKRLLQSAAVVGPEVPVALLETIVEDPDEHVVQAGLAHLRDAEFLYESRLYPELVYSFRHTLTHDVVYDGVLLERRRALHAKLVGAIERLHVGRLAEHVERLAHHALRGEQWGPGIGYVRQAAARARARAANQEAVGWLDQAVAALAHLPETPSTLAQSVDVHLELRGAFYALGEFDRMLASIHEAERLATTLGDPRRLGWVAFHRAESLRLAGRLTEAREHLERARATADELRDLPLQVAANQYLGLTRHALGDYVGAAANMQTVVSLPLEQVEAADFSHSLAASHAGFRAVSTAWLARCLAETGRFNDALSFGRGALRAAEELGHPYPVAFTRWALGSVYGLRGDLGEADALMSAALTDAETANLAVVLPQVMRMLGWVRAMAGRIDEGLDLLTRALSVAESMRIDVAYPAIWGQLGEVHLLAGREEPAERFGRLAVERARAAGQRGDEARALRLLGDVAAARGPAGAADAERAYLGAVSLAETTAMRPLVARCHLDLGRLFNRTGKPAAAARHAATARELLTAMGMAAGAADLAT
jgi:class 3 adenylate cyclase/tetratricopeptide (TPR) repeat protein